MVSARRAAVRNKLQEADEALSQAKYALALKVAMQARRMPMDLDDVDLTRRIDETITRAAKLAEERVADWMDKGHFVPAVQLSAQVNDASPGVASRQQWANDVRDRALEYYGKFVDLWKDADPELQPRVADVRKRIAELTAKER